MRLSRILALTAMLCVVVAIPVAYAQTRPASHSAAVKRGATLTLGVSAGADRDLASAPALTSARWAGKAREIGVQMVRLDVSWASVAPTTKPSGFDASDPDSAGYDWTSVDAEVRNLAAAHFQILITIYDAPTWAQGAGRPANAFAGTWKPNASDFEKFAHAIAERYDGRFLDPLNPGNHLPRVSHWQGWNEPNMSQYLAPQWKNDRAGAKQCLSDKNYDNFTGRTALSPGIYRGLANAFYDGVKSVSSSNYVVLAGTAPYGNPNCVPIGKSVDYRIPPVTFDQDLFCLTGSNRKSKGCNKVTHLDALDNHPYSPPYTGNTDGPHWSAEYSTDVAIPNVGRLTRILSAAERVHTALPKGHKGVWVTEAAWDTTPKDPYGVGPLQEAHWLEESFYELWTEGVHTILWWTLADADTFSLANNPWPSQAGEYYSSGAAKPSAAAFHFPFITHRTAKDTIGVWGRAPASGTLRIERLSGKHWTTVAHFHAEAREVFQLTIRQTHKAAFRATDAGQSSLTWSQGA